MDVQWAPPPRINYTTLWYVSTNSYKRIVGDIHKLYKRRTKILVILPKKPLQIHHLRRRHLFQRTRALYPSKTASGRVHGRIDPTGSLSLVRSCRCFGTTGSTVAGPGSCAELVWEDGRSGEEGLPGVCEKRHPPGQRPELVARGPIRFPGGWSGCNG